MLGDKTEYENESEGGSLSEFENKNTENISSMESAQKAKKGEDNDQLDEKYFHMKLSLLLDTDKKFIIDNIKIENKYLTSELIAFIDRTVKNDFSKTLKEDEAKMIKQSFKNLMIDENDIQIDSLYLNVSGAKIKKYFDSIEEYSYPSGVDVDEGKTYTIIVESTHSLRSNIIKKAEQLRKMFFLFSIIDKYCNTFPDYLNGFYEFFILKYIFNEKDFAKLIFPTNDERIKAFSKNFILLILSNNSFNIHIDAKKKIDKTLYKNVDTIVKKCFLFNENDMTKEKGKKNENFKKITENLKKYEEDKLQDANKKMAKNELIKESYGRLNYLINTVNKNEKRWIVKIVYMDTYVNLTVPKVVLEEQLKTISKYTSTEFKSLNEKIKTLNDSLEKKNIEINNLKNVFSAKFVALRNEFSAKFVDLRNEFSAKEVALRNEFSEKMKEFEKKFESLKKGQS